IPHPASPRLCRLGGHLARGVGAGSVPLVGVVVGQPVPERHLVGAHLALAAGVRQVADGSRPAERADRAPGGGISTGRGPVLAARGGDVASGAGSVTELLVRERKAVVTIFADSA